LLVTGEKYWQTLAVEFGRHYCISHRIYVNVLDSVNGNTYTMGDYRMKRESELFYRLLL